jgi:hypothetical protein
LFHLTAHTSKAETAILIALATPKEITNSFASSFSSAS